MDRQNTTGPIGVLIAGIMVILALFFGADPRASAVGALQGSYPTPTACSAGDDDCQDQRVSMTDTALALTATASAGPYPSPGTGTPSRTPTGTRGTGTPTSTGTPTGTLGAGTPTPTPSATQQLATPTATEITAPAATPTATPIDAPTCMPGVPIAIAGSGPPYAAFLLYFGERAVGGGSINATGRFLARLTIGQERAGIYSVTVRLRGTTRILREVTCSVPEVTPTPTPRARDSR